MSYHMKMKKIVQYGVFLAVVDNVDVVAAPVIEVVVIMVVVVSAVGFLATVAAFLETVKIDDTVPPVFGEW